MQRGFSLIEITVTLAIASIVAAAATSATISVYRSTRVLEQEAAVDEDAKILLDVIKGRLRQLGGGSLRPWQAVSKKCVTINGAACAGSGEQIHFIDVNPAFEQCPIASSNGTTNAAVTPTGTCCTAQAGFATLPVIWVPANAANGGWRVRKCAPTACGCAFSTVAGTVDVAADNGVTADYSGGFIVAGQSVSYFVKTATTTHELHVLDDDDQDGVYKDRLLHDLTYDVQLQFGHDATQDGTFNGVWAPAIDNGGTTLRMVRVGLVIGARAPGLTSASSVTALSNQVFTAPNTGKDGQRLRHVVGATALRNLLFFY